MSDATRRLSGRRLLLRADAGARTGTGHLMRMIALGQAWLDLGGEARWLLAEAPAPLRARIEAEGIVIGPVDAEVGGTADGAQLREELASAPGAVAVADGMTFGGAFLAALGGEAGRVLLVDDMALLDAWPVGWVLNQNAHADRAAYPADATCRFLLGLRYALLRREFGVDVAPRPVAARASRLLVTFGGSDPTGMTLRTMRAIERLAPGLRDGLAVRVIVGAANRDGPAIEAWAGRGAIPGLEVLHAVDDMPAQLAWADLAVTSGGSTVWELARYGCPALVIETAPPEVLLVRGLEAVGLYDRLGPEEALGEAELARRIAHRIDDVTWRTGMRERGMRLVDGHGARRVALELAGQPDPGEDLT